MPGSNRDSETFLATSDSRVVDGLNIDVMLHEKFVRCLLRQSGVADENRNNMRSAGSTNKISPISKVAEWYLHNRNVNFSEPAFDFADVDLFELAITDVLLLVGNASLSAGDCCGRKRCREYETRSVGPNHIHKVVRPSDITSNSAVSFPQST